MSDVWGASRGSNEAPTFAWGGDDERKGGSVGGWKRRASHGAFNALESQANMAEESIIQIGRASIRTCHFADFLL